ncbi:hypothetical protein ACJMK2_001363, partial [Sinanodonta woodiana]
VCSKHFIDGRPTAQNPIPVLEMGYQPVTPTTPGRRPLKRLRLEPPQNSSPTSRQPKPLPDPLFSSTPVKPQGSEIVPDEEKMLATPINCNDETLME